MKSRSAYLYLLPVLIGFTVFTLGPVMASLYLSLTHYEIAAAPVFVGLLNYKQLLNEQLFWQVVGNTFYYAFLYVPLSVGVSLALALLLEKKIRGITFFRTVYFLPVVTPVMVPPATALRTLALLYPAVGSVTLSGCMLTITKDGVPAAEAFPT